MIRDCGTCIIMYVYIRMPCIYRIEGLQSGEHRSTFQIGTSYRFVLEPKIESRIDRGASRERPGEAWNDPEASGSQRGYIVAGSGHRIGPGRWQEGGLGRDPGLFGAATRRLGGATDDPGAPILDPKLTKNRYRKGSAASPVSDSISDER